MGLFKKFRKQQRKDFWTGLVAALTKELGRTPTLEEIQNFKHNTRRLYKEKTGLDLDEGEKKDN